MRWSHEGVALVSPIRSAGSVRQAVWGMLALFAALNVLWFIAIAPPPAASGFEQCLARSARGEPVCASIRPTWLSWDHPDLESWRAVRGCTVVDDPFALTRMSNVVPRLGTQRVANLEYLRMVRSQSGSCPVPASEARIVELEYDTLRALEDEVWTTRVESSVGAEASWITLRARWHRFGERFLPLWMPALLLGWLVLLTATRRMLRYATPLELEVGATGVRIDGRVVERSAIAYLSIEGRRLRIERWLGPPVYSRPLPPEALSHVMEICENVGLWEEDTEPPPVQDRHRQRAALERLIRTT